MILLRAAARGRPPVGTTRVHSSRHPRRRQSTPVRNVPAAAECRNSGCAQCGTHMGGAFRVGRSSRGSRTGTSACPARHPALRTHPRSSAEQTAPAPALRQCRAPQRRRSRPLEPASVVQLLSRSSLPCLQGFTDARAKVFKIRAKCFNQGSGIRLFGALPSTKIADFEVEFRIYGRKNKSQI